MGIFRGIVSKIRQGLWATRRTLVRGLRSLILGRELDERLIDDVEQMLLGADVGVAATARLIEGARADYRAKKLVKSGDLLEYLKREIAAILARGQAPASDGGDASDGPSGQSRADGLGDGLVRAPQGVTVILVTGVNGAGKTTSIAKLAHRLKGRGLRVMLGACDTFRAGAVRQLEIWSERLGVELVKGQQGGDPAAVAFDACKAAVARGADVLILDTAGRLQTQDPLMRQLGKIHGVVGRLVPGGPHESLLVLDATTGQNALGQAQEFGKTVRLTGIVLSKLDGTAKGGVVIAIRHALELPVRYVGVGETLEDLQPFEAGAFVEAMFSEEETQGPA